MLSNRNSYLFTSESVSEGHPDKLCDQISDAILDLFLSKNPHARVACEAFVTTDYVLIGGETLGPFVSKADIEDIVRNVIQDVGYDKNSFDLNKARIDIRLHEQSPDIAYGVDGRGEEFGAGDQGIMFGYACRETDCFMPAPIYYAHNILQNLSRRRRSGCKELGADAKAQITLHYEEGRPCGVHSLVVSTQHQQGISQETIRNIVKQEVRAALPPHWNIPQETFYVNPTGQFVIGGPKSDAGLTGRKIIVDTYGGASPHGGGAFSGKDPSKVDRSAAYMARYLAKNIVAANLADRCVLQLAYAIGITKPLALYVDFCGTGRIDEALVEKTIPHLVDLTPRGMCETLSLNAPIYKSTAVYGHFGRQPQKHGEFRWEELNLVKDLKNIINL